MSLQRMMSSPAVSWIAPGSPTVRNSAVEARSLGGQPATLE